MSTSVLDIQKGDTIEVVEYATKQYILGTELPEPLTNDAPSKYFIEGVGELVDSDNNPLESVEGTRKHLTSLVVNNDDTIMRTDGKIFYAIV